jgi:hypothetical protein
MAVAAIPVALFAYARPAHLRRALACLRENQVPLLHVFCDGAKTGADRAAVDEVRAVVRAINWCEVHLVERERNLGLGANVLAGLGVIAARYPAFVVWEDDLICVPGTYAWVCAVLRHYAEDQRVMSVTAWTHPRVIPSDVGEAPYFDARAECWVWGTWSRAWPGMAEENAEQKMQAAARRGFPPASYGADLPPMARVEQRKNIWAVRWLYHHFEHGGLCVRPPWSMVEHIGFDAGATNAASATDWANPPLRAAPPVPARWPEPREHPGCQRLWQRANPGGWRRIVRKIRARLAQPA